MLLSFDRMRKIHVCLVGQEFLNWDLFDSKNQTAGLQFFKLVNYFGSGLSIFGIGEYPFPG